MLAIARDEHLDVCLRHASEDQVVVWVAGRGLHRPLWRRNRLHRQIDEQCFNLLPSLRVERELLHEDALQLLQDWLRQDQLKATVYRFLDYATRRPSRDKRGDQHVGVEGDAQGSAPLGAQLVDQRLGIFWADSPLLGLLAPEALQGNEAPHLHLTTQSVADDLASSLAQAPRKGIGLLSEVLGQRDGEQAIHMKSSYQGISPGLTPPGVPPRFGADRLCFCSAPEGCRSG